MAQAIYRQPLVNVPIPNNRNGGAFTECAVIHEPVAAAIGEGPNQPYIAVYLETIGGEDAETFTDREAEVRITYTDGTFTRTAITPDGTNALPEPVTSAAQWRVFRANGVLRVVASQPTAATVVAQNAVAASRERLPVSGTKTIDYVDVFVSE